MRSEEDDGAEGCEAIPPRPQSESDAVHTRVSPETYRLLYQELFDFAIDCQLVTDGQGLILEANHAASALLRYPKAFLIGKPLGLLVGEGRRGRFYECLMRLGQAAGKDEFETRLACRGELRDVVARANSAGLEPGRFGIRWLIRDISERKAMETARQDPLRRLVAAEEGERRRISRELHDQLGQELTGLMLGLKALERFLPADSPGHLSLRDLREAADRIGRATHDLAVDLRPTVLDDVGLQPALAGLIQRWSDQAGTPVDYHFSLQGNIRLSPEIESTLYRLVQESLNNIAKHAVARRASVIVEQHGSHLIALIEDDGKGFEIEGGIKPTQLGLLGMEERSALIGGDFQVESSRGVGTTVRIRIPLILQARSRDHGEDPNHSGR